MKSILTKMTELTTMVLVGKTEAGSAEVQPARDNQLKATNCRRDGSYTPAIPFYEQGQFRALLCLKKPDKTAPPKAGSVSAEGRNSLLIVKRICPIHAEPVHNHGAYRDISKVNPLSKPHHFRALWSLLGHFRRT